MNVRYKNTYADAIAFATFHNLRSIPLLAFVFAMSLLSAWSSLPNEATGIIRVLTLVIMTLLIFCALLLFQLIFNIYWYAASRNKRFLAEHQIELTTTALIETTAYTRLETQWPGIVSVKRGRKHLFVFESPNRAHCIPMRAFATRSEFEEFTRLAMEAWKYAKQRA